MIQRHRNVLNILSNGKQATVNDLSDQLSVSPATIRQDLSSLENQGFLRRIHGGAVIDESDDISHRMAVNYERKLRIARAAKTFVNEGETIFIESGSINALFAKEVSTVHNVTIITCNAFIAKQVNGDGGNVILLGGLYQKESESLVGNLAKICLEQLNFSRAFIGVDGFTVEQGFTGRDMMRAELNNEIIVRSPQVFVLSDSSKFGRIATSRYCGAEEIDILITDKSLPEEFKSYFQDSSVNLILTEA